MPIQINKKFEPLYTTKKPIVLCTGGRGSSKTWNTSLFTKRLTYTKGHVVLYVRYTMKSAGDSVIPEFNKRIDDEGDYENFHITKTDIINTFSGSKILFRGIKTSSGNQLGILKGIEGLSVMVGDELQEWEDESDFEDLELSIREDSVQNLILLIMNPTDDSHFIYKKYIEHTHKIEIIDGVPVQISTHPDVLHIHTCYLDNLEHLDDDWIRKVEKLRAEHLALPEEKQKFSKYATKVIGRWSDMPEGVIFKKVKYVDSFDDSLAYNFGLDFGFHPDPDVLVKVAVDTKNKIIYVQELFMEYEQGYEYLNRRLSRFCTSSNQIVTDTNDGRARNEMVKHGFHVVKAKKGAGSVGERLKSMQEYEIHVVGESKNLKEALRKYKWDDKKAGIPINKFKHFPDAIGYAFDYLTTEVSIW